MKSIRRILALLLVALTVALCLAACGGNSPKDGLVFRTPNGVTLVIGDSAEEVVSSLGTWRTLNTSESCGGFQGKDHLYTYDGFRLYTTPDEDGQVICKVELTDDSVKTPQGLYIGMSRAEAETAMKGFSSEAVGDNLVYTSGSTKLQVIFRDGAVTGILYVAA